MTMGQRQKDCNVLEVVAQRTIKTITAKATTTLTISPILCAKKDSWRIIDVRVLLVLYSKTMATSSAL